MPLLDCALMGSSCHQAKLQPVHRPSGSHCSLEAPEAYRHALRLRHVQATAVQLHLAG